MMLALSLYRGTAAWNMPGPSQLLATQVNQFTADVSTTTGAVT